jgi:hypothetical protein
MTQKLSTSFVSPQVFIKRLLTRCQIRIIFNTDMAHSQLVDALIAAAHNVRNNRFSSHAGQVILLLSVLQVSRGVRATHHLRCDVHRYPPLPSPHELTLRLQRRELVLRPLYLRREDGPREGSERRPQAVRLPRRHNVLHTHPPPLSQPQRRRRRFHLAMRRVPPIHGRGTSIPNGLTATSSATSPSSSSAPTAPRRSRPSTPSCRAASPPRTWTGRAADLWVVIRLVLFFFFC